MNERHRRPQQPDPTTRGASGPTHRGDRTMRRSCSCTASSATTARATTCSKSSRAPSWRSGRASRWRWWRRPASGKSTLLHVAGLLEHPDAGEVYIDKVATSTLSDRQRTRLRRTEIGFVYQFHHLLPEFSAIENVMLPQMIRGLSRKEATRPGGRAADLSRAEGAPDPPAGGTVRRRAAAGRASRARSPMRRASCWPTSRPAISIRTPPSTCSMR